MLAIGLLELVGYLIPGGVVLGALLYQFYPVKTAGLMGDLIWQVTFVALSYLMGHALTVFSSVLWAFRGAVKFVFKGQRRRVRLGFYPDLKKQLEAFFGCGIPDEHEYEFALRVVSEFQPRSAQTIDRLYALTIFARNSAFALALVGLSLLLTDLRLAGTALVLSIVFFKRYYDVEIVLVNTVFRSAYVYFCSLRHQNAGEGVKTLNPGVAADGRRRR